MCKKIVVMLAMVIGVLTPIGEASATEYLYCGDGFYVDAKSISINESSNDCFDGTADIFYMKKDGKESSHIKVSVKYSNGMYFLKDSNEEEYRYIGNAGEENDYDKTTTYRICENIVDYSIL